MAAERAADRVSGVGAHRAWQPFLRGVTALMTLDGFAQAIFAGRFMAGSYDGLDAHALNGMVMAAGMLFMTVCFAIAWRFGAAPGRAAARCAAVTVVTGVEIALGHQQILAVHIPLGVALIAGLVVVTMQTWRPPGTQGGDQPTGGIDEQPRPDPEERPGIEPPGRPAGRIELERR
ncbi:hypothetical protein KO481_27495 [Nocardia sp. NEAU-G5]|uniref:Integral membrane protein n=1 Tax=Nocardia albiluteola TaxID=2842303 RepID=A0ABS6B7C4_9NOCA|nr:hypothetical protein [Nocardia albiluteola]MBU3065260.1 hypothetical protein [Nocardia albiluteola]